MKCTLWILKYYYLAFVYRVFLRLLFSVLQLSLGLTLLSIEK